MRALEHGPGLDGPPQPPLPPQGTPDGGRGRPPHHHQPPLHGAARPWIIPQRLTWTVAGLLAFAQLLTGTDPLYAILILVFILTAGATVNLLGGLRTVGGFSVFVMALKIVVISQVAKVVMLQPGDSNLLEPVQTAMVLAAGMFSVAAAAAAVRMVKFRKPVIQRIEDPEKLMALSIVFYLLGTASYLYSVLYGYNFETGEVRVGGILSVARVFQETLNLSAIASTAYVLVKSKGRRSMTLASSIPYLTIFVIGVLYTSKFWLLIPIACYLCTCIAFRFRYTRMHVFVFFVVALVAQSMIFSYAQYGRGVNRSPRFSETLDRTQDFVNKFVFNPEYFNEVSEEVSAVTSLNERFLYYGKPMGFLDRFSLIEPVDELVSATMRNGESEWDTILPGILAIPPRFLSPNKPVASTGNYLGHKIECLYAGNKETQVSFGFIADSYSSFTWAGTLLIPFILCTLFFTAYKKLTGTLDRNVWTVAVFVNFQHSFTEQPIAGVIGLFTTYAVSLLLMYGVGLLVIYAYERLGFRPDGGAGVPVRRSERSTTVRAGSLIRNR